MSNDPIIDLAGSPGGRSSLPRPLTPLLGREREIADLRDLVRDLAVRLATSTGPGGAGKTRLALAVTAAVEADFPGGVWFVELAPVRDLALVASTVARVLNVHDSLERDPEASIRAMFANWWALLVLDNCEQLPGLAPIVAPWLANCAGLTILATSRAPLRVSAEHLFPASSMRKGRR